MRALRVVGACLVGAGATSLVLRPLDAQAVRQSVAKGIEAYHDLEFETSARLLREVLAGPDARALGDSLQAEVLGFVGAAELLLGRRTEAAAAFTWALERSPTFRIDTLVFPPAVTAAFETTRRGTALVIARATKDTTFIVGEPSFRVRLIASAPHAVRIAVCEAEGGVVRMLFDGRITDSLWVAWDGLVGPGAPASDGLLALCAESVGPDGTARWMRLPLQVTRIEPVTTPRRVVTTAPPRTPGATSSVRGRALGRRALIVGVAGAALSIALPSVIATSSESRPWRFVVGGAVLTASLLARRTIPVPAAPPTTTPTARGAAPRAAPPSVAPNPPAMTRLRVVALLTEARSRAR